MIENRVLRVEHDLLTTRVDELDKQVALLTSYLNYLVEILKHKGVVSNKHRPSSQTHAKDDTHGN